MCWPGAFGVRGLAEEAAVSALAITQRVCLLRHDAATHRANAADCPVKKWADERLEIAAKLEAEADQLERQIKEPA